MTDLITKYTLAGDIATMSLLLPCLEVKSDSLHCMVQQSNIEVVKLLLSSELINVNLKNSEGDSPLHVAVQKKNVEMVKLLLSNKADITSRNNLGLTPMFLALEQRSSTDIVNALMESYEKWFEGRTDDDKKYYQVCGFIVKKSSGNLRNFLNENKDVEVDFKALKEFESPLLLAVAVGKFQVVEALLEAGANVNYRKGSSGMSALHAAVKGGKIKITDLLLEYNADVNCYLSETTLITPLHYAVKNSGRILVKMLLEKGALVDFLGNDRAFKSALHLAVEENDIAKCKLLINSGANLDHVDEDGRSVLHLAIQSRRNLDMVELFLANKANPNIADNNGETPLFYIFDVPDWGEAISSEKRLELFKKLTHHGADPDVQNDDGTTVFHKAFIEEYDIAEFLLKNEFISDVNYTDKYGQTPLSATFDDLNCRDFMLFLNHGGDINIGFKQENVEFLIPTDYQYINEINDQPFNNLECPVYAHFEKLRLLGYNVNEILWAQYQKAVCEEHALGNFDIQIADFESELEHLKTLMICYNPQKSLYDILLMRQNQVTAFGNNAEFEHLYKTNNTNFENSFPHYGWLLNLQYRRSHRRRQLMQSVEEILKTALEFCVPELLTFILRYLKNDELKQILKSNHK